MQLDVFLKELKKIYGDHIKSIVLYGSAAAEDYRPGISDYNLMIVFENLEIAQLVKGAKLIRRWMKAGNPEPLLIDQEHIETSKDVFPIEFSDIRDCYQLIHGDHPIKDLVVDDEHLRLQCERELKQLILSLRERYVALYPRKRPTKQLLLSSMNALFPIVRTYLRLSGEEPIFVKKTLLERFNEKTSFDTAVFKELLSIRQKEKKLPRNEVLPFFERYLTTLEKVTSLVDSAG